MKNIDSTSIAHIYDIANLDSTVIINTEYVKGDNLETYIRKNRIIDEKTAIEWFKAILLAIKQLHDNHILHLDIKPSNIIRKPDGGMVLIDFDSARKIEDISIGMDYGTKNYIAPERLVSASSDYRSDIYSLGIAMYYLLTQRYPYENNKYTSLERYKVKVSAEFERIIKKCIEIDPNNRYESCNTVLDSLSELTDIKIKIKQCIRSPIARRVFAGVLIGIASGVLFFNRSWCDQILNTLSGGSKQFLQVLLKNKSLTISSVLTLLIVIIKLLVRQSKKMPDKLLETVIELPIDVLTVVAGYVGAMFGTPVNDYFMPLLFLLVSIAVIAVICSLCYYIEKELKTPDSNKVLCAFFSGASYFISVIMLISVTRYRF